MEGSESGSWGKFGLLVGTPGGGEEELCDFFCPPVAPRPSM